MSRYLSRMAFEFHFEAADPNGAVAKTREIERAIAAACGVIGISLAEAISRIHIAENDVSSERREGNA